MRKRARRAGHGLADNPARRGAPADALQAGQTAPDFTLPDEAERAVSLAAPLAKGPVVLAFLDGGDRRAAEAHLHAAAAHATAVGTSGGTLLAISSHDLFAPSDVAVILLRDMDSVVATQYGLGRSATGGGRTATFVVDQTGMIVLSLLDAEAGSDLVYTNVLPVLAALSRRAPPQARRVLARPDERPAEGTIGRHSSQE